MIQLIFWAALIGGVIYFFVKRRERGHGLSSEERSRIFFISRLETLRESFLALGVLFAGATLLSLNNHLGQPLTWLFILFITTLIAFLVAYYLKSLANLTLALVAFSIWAGGQSAEWIQAASIKGTAVLVVVSFVAAVYFILGYIHRQEEKMRRFSLVYSVLGLTALTSVIFGLSTRIGLMGLDSLTRGASYFESWPLVILIILILAVIVGSLIYAAKKKLMLPGESLAVLAAVVLIYTITMLPQASLFESSGRTYFSANTVLTTAGVAWLVVYNLAIFLEAAALVFAGYWRREGWLVNLGAVFMFLIIIIKYFDWFFTFMDKSVFFISAGLLLFTMGWFMEKARRSIVSQIKTAN